jgi:putative FmdB family regulatory protein
MPTYAYKCDNCEHDFELFQSITAKVVKKCPECKRLKLRRLIGTGAGIIFKGSGFYETDYRSDGYKKAAEKDKKTTETSSSDKKETSSKSKDTKSKTDAKPKSDTKKS